MNKHLAKKAIGDATPEELLFALIESQGLHDGPYGTKYVMPVKECLVAIGADNIATIRLEPEACKRLEEIALYGKGEPKTLDELQQALQEQKP